MRRFLLVLILFLSAVYFSFSAPVVINGKSSAGDAYIFRVYQQKDPISGENFLADQKRPDKQGNFSLTINVDQIQQVTIMVGLQSLQIYVQPEKSYSLIFNQITLKDQNIFLPQKPLLVVFEQEDLLNLVIDGFEYEYQTFLTNKFLQLVKFKDKSIYEKFEAHIFQLFNETKFDDPKLKEFFRQYIDYRLAELRLTSRIQDKENAGLALLAHQTILFNNPAYNHFFTKFFDKYAIEFNNGKEFNEIMRLINTGLPINLLFDKLGKDPILVEEKLRELVLLSSLKQLYYSKDIQQSSVNEIINYLSLHSKFELNRNIAKNLSHSLGRFNKGNPLPEISLSDFQNIHHTIDNFAGKKLYIMFLSDQCETCEADLKILKTLNHEFSQIQFLTILVGYSKSNALNWAQNLNLPWKVLWFNDDYGMLNDYRIKNFPVYFVADSNGNLLNAFPPSPRENLKSYFQYLNEGKKQKSGTEPTEFFQKN